MDEIILTEQQKRCIPDVTFELIPIRNLVSNQAYQRPLSEGHIRSAAADTPGFLTGLAAACPLDRAAVLLRGGTDCDFLLCRMNKELYIVITCHAPNTGHTEFDL